MTSKQLIIDQNTHFVFEIPIVMVDYESRSGLPSGYRNYLSVLAKHKAKGFREALNRHTVQRS
jgi:hypothetical protein